MPAERRRAGLLSCLATLVGLLVAGCTPTAPPTVTPSATATPHDFTLGTSGPIHTADPAVALADTDVLIATSVFQRLMLVLPSTGELKPDAATDCLFTSPTLYECTLPKGLLFHNGHELTSSDVKFSVQRALRFATPGTAISMLTSLKRIDTPDPLTVRFQLSYADNQIGYGLASLSASLVDEQTFDPDTALPLASLPVGSGPYAVEVIDDTGVTFTRFPTYVGPLVGVLERIRLQRLADSVAGEAAISDGSLDMIWRTLEPAALQRVDDEITASTTHTTAQGFTRYALSGSRVTRLLWSADSRLRANATLRQGVSKALQQDRTLRSVVPVGVEGAVEAFDAGGRPKLPSLKGDRITLILAYTPSAPGAADLANVIRGRIEELDKVSVRLVTSGSADLILTDSLAWVNTAMGWLQAFTDSPLAGSQTRIAQLQLLARTTTGTQRLPALGQLQQLAAVDATVVPVSQTDGILLTGQGVVLVGEPFGSGGALGLWSIRHG